MSYAKCTFPEWHFENSGGFWAPKWTPKGKETEHQFRVDFGCPFWPTWSHFSGPRGVSDPGARWPPPGRPPIFLTVKMCYNYSRTLKVLFPSPGPAGMGRKASCFFLDRALRSMLPHALPQFKKVSSPTFALKSGQEICMVCFLAAFASS